MKAWSIILVGLVGLVGCGGTTTSDPDSGTDSGTDGSPTNDGGPIVSCPLSPPTAGSACVGAHTCEYGTNPDPSCNQSFICQASVWVDQSSGTICPPQSQCPASYAAIPNGQDCTPDQLTCGYPEGECICTKSFGGLQKTTPAWDCFPAQQGCPSPRPKIGEACATPNQSCDYGACSGGVELTCEGYVWQVAQTLCPG